MPVRHVAMFRFVDGVEHGQLAELSAALSALPGKVPELEAYAFGQDLGLSDRTWDFVVVADVADAEAFERYRVHPAHVEVVEQRFGPIVEERAAVQIQL